ncbi:MAG: ABC transporter permease [Rickettsiaceae bacterium H1]|nr:ABC transporter permease [Rickettsiaceae bacterium H1]
MLSIIGRYAYNLIYSFIYFIFFLLRVIYHCTTSTSYYRELFFQFFKLGYLSVSIVTVTSIFTGAVLALQSYMGLSQFNIENSIPGLIIISMTRELGPVLIGLIFAGRVGSGICAELSSMKITEQIDALATLYIDPFKYLIFPRVISGIVCLPLLVIVGDIFGIYGGYLVGVYKLGFNGHMYIENTVAFLNYSDVFLGLIKAAIFGFVITLIGCYYGYHCNSGAKGIGDATTKSVVINSILILLLNYVIASVFFS